jgi:DNA-binding IclR family transcriptional regulator
MAFLPLKDLVALGPFPLGRVGPRTVGSWPVLAEQIAATRDRGFAVDYEEWRPGLANVAAPALGDGMPTVAISITCRTSADVERLGPIVRTAADRIAQRLRDLNSLPVAV